MSPAPVLALDVVDSTNSEARRRAEAGETGPLWIIAARQTAGRGRQGRPWSTEAGALAATYLAATDKSPTDTAIVAFVAALAVHDFAAAYAPRPLVQLKWPNDVLLDGRKLAGVLVETGVRQDGGRWFAVGFGINLAAAPQGLDRPVVALAEHLKPGLPPPSPTSALAVLKAAFERRLAFWERKGSPAVLTAWRERAAGIPGPCTARLPQESLAGRAEGLDPDGALRLRLPTGEVRRIAAGELQFG